MTETPQPQISLMTRLWSAWLGLLIFAAMSFAALFGLSTTTSNLLLGAIIFATVTGALAIAAWWLGRLGLAAGLIVGYLLMSLLSGGSCTLLAEARDYNFLGGAAYYGMALIASLVLLTIYSLIDRSMNGRRSP